MKMSTNTLEQIRRQIRRVKDAGGFYAKRLAEIEPEDITDQAAFENLPFSEKADLRDAYPLGLAAVPEEEIVTTEYEDKFSAQGKNINYIRLRKR